MVVEDVGRRTEDVFLTTRGGPRNSEGLSTHQPLTFNGQFFGGPKP